MTRGTAFYGRSQAAYRARASSARRRARSRAADVPADQRQSRRFRQACQSQRDRHARRSDQQNQDPAGEAGFVIHTAMSRIPSSRPNSTMPTESSPSLASTCTTCPASMTSSMMSSSSTGALWSRREGRRLVQLDANGAHFIGLANAVDLKAAVWQLGNEQLEWLRTTGVAPPRPRSSSSRTFRCGRSIRPGWAPRRGARPRLSQALRVGDGAQRPYPSNHAKVEGNVTFTPPAPTAFPAGAGAAPRQDQ